MRRQPEAEDSVTLLPSGLKRTFPPGTLLADALFDMGVSVPTPCGLRGTCRKCTVRLAGGKGEVLSCRTPVHGDMAVHAEPGVTCGDHSLGFFPGSRAGAAVDIGTTTVRIALVDMEHGGSFESCSFLNPQRRFGHDVISRIAAAGDEKARSSLTGLIRKAVAIHLESVRQGAGLSRTRFERVVFSGNTTMLYLLFGLDVQTLGRHPFTILMRDFVNMPPEAAGLDPAWHKAVSALPVLGAFTGGDLVGGLSLCHARGASSGVFFIDLGTNGEIFVIDGKGRIFTTSCAMGPALEGMNISWGMTAVDGAITHVRESPRGLTYNMLGTGEPAGITGTALIDLMAILLERGIVTAGGTLRRDLPRTAFPFPLEPAGQKSAPELMLWGRIRLTQKDIRNVQLAKAASMAASAVLLDAACMKPHDVRHVYVAGALGAHMELNNLTRLGFIPDFPCASFDFLGNTSLLAAAEACMDPAFLALAAMLRDRANEVVLSRHPAFQETFLRSLNFPERS